jgi:serine acetyltransferase
MAIPENKVAVDVPAKVVRDVDEHDKKFWKYCKDLSADLQ